MTKPKISKSRRNPVKGLESRLKNGEISSKSPGEILLGVALGIEGYDNPTVRTAYRSNLIIVEKELENFRDNVLKVTGNPPNHIPNYNKVPLKNLSEFYLSILQRIIDCKSNKMNYDDVEIHIENLENLIRDKKNNSQLHRKISGEYTFFEPEELLFMESRREKSQERIFSKVALNLAMAKAIQTNSINFGNLNQLQNSDKKILRTPEEVDGLVDYYLKKAEIEDFFGMRIVSYHPQDIFQYIGNMRAMSQTCDGFKVLNKRNFENHRLEKKYWQNEEALESDFFQNRPNGYKGWKFKLVKNLSCTNSNLNFSSNRFEIQMFSLPWFLYNEASEKTNHIAYEQSQERQIEILPDSVQNEMERYIGRLSHFYNQTKCYIEEK